MKIKNIIAIDCDGTILNENRELTDFSYNVLKELQKENLVVFATGRNDADCKAIFENRKPVGHYAICNCGAVVYNLETNQEIFGYKIPRQKAMDLFELLKKNFGKLEIFEDNTASDKDYSCLNILFEDDNKYEKAIGLLSETFPELESFIMQDSFDALKWITITKKGANKGQSLLKLIKNLKLEGKNITAIGDSVNDISLLKVANVKVAMGNAIQEIKNFNTYSAAFH